MSQSCDRAVALDRSLPNSAKAVYLLLSTELDSYRYRPLKQKYLSRSLGMTVPTVSRAMQLLCDKGYLDMGPRDGRERTWRLPNSCVW